MAAFPYIIYSRLPEIIPTHINIIGEIDGYGSKDTFNILPFFGVIIYVGLSIMQKYPHVFNYPVEVNEDNCRQLYSLGIKCCRFIKIISTLIITYITYHITCYAFGIEATMIPVIFLALGLLISMIYFIVKMSRCK